MAWVVLVVAFYTHEPVVRLLAALHPRLLGANALHPSLGVLILAALGADALLRRIPRPSLHHAVCALVLAASLAVPWVFRDFNARSARLDDDWAALTAMQPKVDPQARQLVADREMAYGPNALSIAYELACTDGRHASLLPPAGGLHGGAGPAPSPGRGRRGPTGRGPRRTPSSCTTCTRAPRPRRSCSR